MARAISMRAPGVHRRFRMYNTQRVTLPPFPIISRGLPYYSSQGGSFGGSNDEANAIDADYGTTWDSVYSPNGANPDGSGGPPQWYLLDISSVPTAARANVWCCWKTRYGNYYEPSAALGITPTSVFAALARHYKLQGHASLAQPAVGDAGWVDLAAVTDNRYNARIHTGLDLTSYNWFRFYCTASSGVTGATESVSLELDLRNASAGGADSIFMYGDSITMMGFGARAPGNLVWPAVGPFENALEALTGRHPPVCVDGGVGGWTAADAYANRVAYLGSTPCKYYGLSFGTNDAHNAAVDLGTQTPAGPDSTYAQTWQADMQGCIDYAYGRGMLGFLPYIPWRDANPSDGYSPQNVVVLNQNIDRLRTANADKLLLGPDLYALFAAHPELLQPDKIHPAYDHSTAVLYNGYTGYEWYLQLWRDQVAGQLY